MASWWAFGKDLVEQYTNRIAIPFIYFVGHDIRKEKNLLFAVPNWPLDKAKAGSQNFNNCIRGHDLV